MLSALKFHFNLLPVRMKRKQAEQMDVMISLAKDFFNLSIFLLLAAFQSLGENRIICTDFITHIRLEDLHNSKASYQDYYTYFFILSSSKFEI